MRTTAVGPTGCLDAGKVYVVSTEEGKALIDARAAEELAEPNAPTETTAIDSASENAAERTGRTRRPRA